MKVEIPTNKLNLNIHTILTKQKNILQKKDFHLSICPFNFFNKKVEKKSLTFVVVAIRIFILSSKQLNTIKNQINPMITREEFYKILLKFFSLKFVYFLYYNNRNVESIYSFHVV